MYIGKLGRTLIELYREEPHPCDGFLPEGTEFVIELRAKILNKQFFERASEEIILNFFKKKFTKLNIGETPNIKVHVSKYKENCNWFSISFICFNLLEGSDFLENIVSEYF